MRLTLAVVFVHSGMSLAACIVRLLKQVKVQKIKLGCLFLDRGFAGIEVYRCLQRRRIPAIIACPIRGKEKGTRALCTKRHSYTTTHTFHSQAQGNFTAQVVVVRSYTQMRQLRARTNSRNPVLRFLFMALAFILLNLWLLLRFRFCQCPSRGRIGRPLDEARFRLSRFASFLSRAIEHIYGSCSAIVASVLPLSV